jgi:hypothetical protein
MVEEYKRTTDELRKSLEQRDFDLIAAR